MFKIFKVSGTSMQPIACPGDYIIATTILKRLFLKNRLVIFFDEIHSYIIKRVSNSKKSFFTLKSDNTSTTSIFHDKQLDKEQILFVVLLIIKRKNFEILLNFKKKLIKNI
ncbi:MAG: hypothetical protein CMJ08_02150 [Pelagibacterales bacterium]|nr:hypothetical protein [Pelagibacterales bacterium]